MRKLRENLQYLWGIFALEKKMIVFLTIEAILSAILSFVSILAPKYLLDAVQKFGALRDIVSTILFVCASYLMCEILLAYIRKSLKISQQMFEDKKSDFGRNIFQNNLQCISGAVQFRISAWHYIYFVSASLVYRSAADRCCSYKFLCACQSTECRPQFYDEDERH